ncbi:MAG: hypothetical protein DIU62_004145 [Pseudomonadota bacterium]|jgi:hypothetical protein
MPMRPLAVLVARRFTGQNPALTPPEWTALSGAQILRGSGYPPRE